MNECVELASAGLNPAHRLLRQLGGIRTRCRFAAPILCQLDEICAVWCKLSQDVPNGGRIASNWRDIGKEGAP